MPMKTIEGYSKEKYTNTSVLLAGGGAKALSDFIGSISWDSTNKKIKYTPVEGSATDLVTLSWDNIANKPTSLPANGGNADRTKFLETFHQNSTTNTWGSQYPIWAQWSDATNVRLKCTNYTVWTDKADNADKLDGQHGSRYTSALGGSNYVTFTVEGDANTYYPVVITNTSDYYPMQLVNISRAYYETAPDTWNTSTHRGGLTLTLLWNGSRYWDGNTSGGACYCVYHTESYSTMVGGLGNSTGGKVVWLRGGGAVYHIHSMNGTSTTVTVYTSTYTDSAKQSFAPKTSPEGVSVRWPGYAEGADYATSAGNADTAERANYLSGHSSSPDNSHPGHGARVFYSWDIGSVGNATSGYSTGITIGSHPSDTGYGFQIVQNLWDDRTYTRRYNKGWQEWKTLAWTSDIPTKISQLTNDSGYITSSGSCNYATSAGNADSAGSAERARYLTCPDTRSSAPAPGDYTATSTGVSFDFKESSVTGLSGYSGVMTFRPYSSAQDWTGGEVHQIAFLAGGGLYHRIGTSSWGSWERILTSSNWSSYISIPSVGNDTNYYPIRSYTSGLQISSYSGSTDCALFVPYAASNQAGVVSTEAQIFSGQKTFSSIRLSTTNFGGYLYFGDDSYAYLAELADDQLTLNATKIFLGISGSQKYYIDDTVFRPVTANSTSSSGIALGSSDYRFTCGYFSDKVYAYKGFYESSDERLKNILNPVKVNLDDLSKLRKVYYLWKDRTEDEIQLGMIAQDVQKLYPELVSVDKETGYLSLAYDKLSVLALEAIDVLYKEHNKLKKHVDELEKLLINNKIY